MVATDERTYALRSCDGTVDIDAARLVIQGAPHATGRTRRPVVIERDEVDRLRAELAERDAGRSGVKGALRTLLRR